MGTAPMEASGSGDGNSSGTALGGPESAARQALSPILPFLGPIEELLLDPAVTEIMVNAADDVYALRGCRIGLIRSPGKLCAAACACGEADR